MTEAEYESIFDAAALAVQNAEGGSESAAECSRMACFHRSSSRGNNNFKCATPTSVGTMDDAPAKGLPIFDLVGNGWEWTSTVFAPYEGFTPMASYPEYSADFFDDKHLVCRGASMFTSQCMIRRSFRNFYQKRYPHVIAKFRIAWDSPS